MAKRSARAGMAQEAPASIPAGEFKARCLRIMEAVRETRREVIITKHGKAVAKLVPLDEEIPDSYGAMNGTVRYLGDLVSPDHDSWDEPAS